MAYILVGNNQDNPKKSIEGKTIGIDLGLADFCITSEGFKYNNSKHIAKQVLNLKRKQQKLVGKQKGSNTTNQAIIKVAKLKGKID